MVLQQQQQKNHYILVHYSKYQVIDRVKPIGLRSVILSPVLFFSPRSALIHHSYNSYHTPPLPGFKPKVQTRLLEIKRNRIIQ